MILPEVGVVLGCGAVVEHGCAAGEALAVQLAREQLAHEGGEGQDTADPGH